MVGGLPSGHGARRAGLLPDGQRIVAEALDATDLTVSTGLYTVPVNTATHPLTAVPSLRRPRDR